MKVIKYSQVLSQGPFTRIRDSLKTHKYLFNSVVTLYVAIALSQHAQTETVPLLKMLPRVVEF